MFQPPLVLLHVTVEEAPVQPSVLQVQAPFEPEVDTQAPPGKASGSPHGTHTSE